MIPVARKWFYILVVLGLCIAYLLRRAQDPKPGPPSTDPACASPPMDQCAFYADCLESRYQCGLAGYPIGYGQYYCQKFSNESTLFDTRGVRWMLDTMHCLQLALVSDAVNATPTTCQALRGRAFASHAGCYVGNGFCTLGVKDWEAVLEIVNIMALFSSWDALKAAIETATDCSGFYAFMVEKGIF
ncbi:hypothetical protein JVU11DRAFT_4269 [Chiua virens]|nr:hypothetical protein JVU11DRAFT_4269 [Chiua virens]